MGGAGDGGYLKDGDVEKAAENFGQLDLPVLDHHEPLQQQRVDLGVLKDRVPEYKDIRQGGEDPRFDNRGAPHIAGLEGQGRHEPLFESDRQPRLGADQYQPRDEILARPHENGLENGGLGFEHNQRPDFPAFEAVHNQNDDSPLDNEIKEQRRPGLLGRLMGVEDPDDLPREKAGLRDF